MNDDRRTVERLLSCCDAIYRVLGEVAPRCANDTYVVRIHEMSRAYGSLALAMRTYLGNTSVAPLPIVQEVLTSSFAGDPTGAMTLYAMAVAVGPRLLVSLRDARDGVTAPEVRELIDRAALVTVGEIRTIAEVSANQVPIEDPSWLASARQLVDTLENSGNAESLGFLG